MCGLRLKFVDSQPAKQTCVTILSSGVQTCNARFEDILPRAFLSVVCQLSLNLLSDVCGLHMANTWAQLPA